MALPTQAEIKYLKHAPLADFVRPPFPLFTIASFLFSTPFYIFDALWFFFYFPFIPRLLIHRYGIGRWYVTAKRTSREKKNKQRGDDRVHEGGRKRGFQDRVEIGCKGRVDSRIRKGSWPSARDGFSHRQETHYIWQRFHSARLSLFSPDRFSWHSATSPRFFARHSSTHRTTSLRPAVFLSFYLVGSSLPTLSFTSLSSSILFASFYRPHRASHFRER